MAPAGLGAGAATLWLRPAPARRPWRASSGRSLIELLVLMNVLIGITMVSVPAVGRILARARIDAAARALGSEIRRLRTEAVIVRRNFGIVFDETDGYRYSVYRDGNGNGVRRTDIREGIDVKVRDYEPLDRRYPGVELRIGCFPPIPEIPPARGSLANLGDPVKFGPHDIISCSPDGTCSSGTLYLSTGSQRMAAVRLRGWNAQVQLWDYDATGRRWRKRGQ